MDQNTNLALQKIVEIQKCLELEIEEHAGLSKKYTRGVEIVRITSDVLIASTTLVGGVVGISLFLTVVEAPAVVIVETIALGIAGLIGTAGNHVIKMLSVTAEKHEQMLLLAKAKLNTISDQVLKALSDGTISAEEYSLILSEYEKYIHMKEELRTTFKKRQTKIKFKLANIRR